jgi:hypothetical protein
MPTQISALIFLEMRLSSKRISIHVHSGHMDAQYSWSFIYNFHFQPYRKVYCGDCSQIQNNTTNVTSACIQYMEYEMFRKASQKSDIDTSSMVWDDQSITKIYISIIWKDALWFKHLIIFYQPSKSAIFWDMSCSLLLITWCLEGTCCLHLQVEEARN